MTLLNQLHTNGRGLAAIISLIAASLVIVLASCTSPLDIDTERRTTTINLDSLIKDSSFIGARGDSLFARVRGERIVFATEVLRPFHNRKIGDAYYITIQATRYGLGGRDYEVMSLRVDAVGDTGVFVINAPYSAPKALEPERPPEYGALYERRYGAFPESYRTGGPKSSGEIRVVKLDRERGVMVGTFRFIGYSLETDAVETIEDGAFRIQLPKP